MTRRRRYQPLNRIWARGRRDPETGCLLLPGDDYGAVSVRGRLDRVHRVAWRAEPPSAGPRGADGHAPLRPSSVLRADSACASAPLGATVARHQSGATPPRRAHPQHVLTEAAVIDIRARYAAGGVRQVELALDHGVARTTVAAVVHRRTWGWLEGGGLMAWGRCDDGFYRHDKVAELDDRLRKGCVSLYWLAIAWCNDRLTDGRVPPGTLRILGADVAEAEELARVGLWEVDGSGWEFTTSSTSTRAVSRSSWTGPSAPLPGGRGHRSDGIPIATRQAVRMATR